MKEKTIGIIGKNKTGKTRNVLFKEVESLIKDEKNLLILDERLEYYNHFGKKLNDEGYTIKVINFNDPLKSDGWNPLDYIFCLYNNGQENKAIELIQKMGQQFFNDKNSSDPFWDNMATNYFIGIVLILIKIAKEKNNPTALNFASILSVMQMGEEEHNETTYMREYIGKLDPMDPIYITLSSVINAPKETRSSIIAVVKSKLNNFFMRPQLLKSFYSDMFSVWKLKDDGYGKVAIFIINYKPLNLLTNVIIEQCYDIVNNYNMDMVFVLDGFDRLFKLNCIQDMIDSANHGNMKLYLTANSKEELEDIYERTTFMHIEKVVVLTEKKEECFEKENYDLPNLSNHEIEYLNFKEYV